MGDTHNPLQRRQRLLLGRSIGIEEVQADGDDQRKDGDPVQLRRVIYSTSGQQTGE